MYGVNLSLHSVRHTRHSVALPLWNFEPKDVYILRYWHLPLLLPTPGLQAAVGSAAPLVATQIFHIACPEGLIHGHAKTERAHMPFHMLGVDGDHSNVVNQLISARIVGDVLLTFAWLSGVPACQTDWECT